MTELRQIIGKNLMELRTEAHLTQAEFAEKLNYSDKAISKWERGESVPDISVLKYIADFFGVTVDYLLDEEHKTSDNISDREGNREEKRRITNRNHLFISLMSIVLVWFIATFVYFLGDSIFDSYLWQSFVAAVPVSLITALVFNSIWGNTRFNYLIISLLIWTTLALLFTFFLKYNLWKIFLLGIPAEICVIFWSRLHYPKNKAEKKNR